MRQRGQLAFYAEKTPMTPFNAQKRSVSSVTRLGTLLFTAVRQTLSNATVADSMDTEN